MQKNRISREVADICPTSEKIEEARKDTRSLKKLSNVFGFFLISMQLIAIIAQISIMLIYYIINLLFYNRTLGQSLVNLINNIQSAQTEIISTFTYFAYMFVPFILVVFILKLHPFKIVPVKGIKNKKIILPAIAVALSFSFLANIITNYILMFLSFIHLESTSPDFAAPSNTLAFTLFFLQICILAPLCEEFIFRGLILHSLKRFGNAFAIVVSAILFSMVHGNLLQIPLAFTVGLLFGFVVIKTGSIWVTVILHASVNIESVVVNLISTKYGDLIGNSVYFGITSLAILVTIAICVHIILRHDFKAEIASYKKSIMPNQFLFKKFALTPGFLIFLIMTIVFVALYIRVI